MSKSKAHSIPKYLSKLNCQAKQNIQKRKHRDTHMQSLRPVKIFVTAIEGTDIGFSHSSKKDIGFPLASLTQ